MPYETIFRDRLARITESRSDKQPSEPLPPVLPEDIETHKRDVKAYNDVLDFIFYDNTNNSNNYDFSFLNSQRPNFTGLRTVYVRGVDGAFTTIETGNDDSRLGTARRTIPFNQVRISPEQTALLNGIQQEQRETQSGIEESRRRTPAFNSALEYVLSESGATEDYIDSIASQTPSFFGLKTVYVKDIDGVLRGIETGNDDSRLITARRTIPFNQVSISEAQGRILKQIIREISSRNQLANSVSRDDKSFDSTLEYLISESNNVSSEYIDLVTSQTPSFFGLKTVYVKDIDGVLRGIETGNDDSRLITARRTIPFNQVSISEADAPIIKKIYAYLYDSNPEISKNFRIYFTDLVQKGKADFEKLKILQAIFRTAGRSDEEFKNLNIFLNEFIEFRKARKFQIEILNKLQSKDINLETLQLLLKRVQDFNYSNLESTNVTANLIERVNKKIVQLTTKKACEFLFQLSGDLNSDEVFSETTPIVNQLVASLGAIDSEEIRTEILNLAQKRELALIRRKLLRLVQEKKTPEEIKRIVDTECPKRYSASIDSEFNYFDTLKAYRDSAMDLSSNLIEFNLDKVAYEIRSTFSQRNHEQNIELINNFPQNSEKARAIRKQLEVFYIKYLKIEKPEEYQKYYGDQVVSLIKTEQRGGYEARDLERNLEAFEYVRERFRESVLPLFSFLRKNRITKPIVEDYIKNQKSFRILVKALEEQRGERGQKLTEDERKYLQSVELLSLFTPLMVACLRADPKRVTEYLADYFDNKSETIQEDILERESEIPFYPLVQIGLGPNGLTALGEVARNNPNLASTMLVIDSGAQPGGPFAVPGGPAWRLNSASSRGTTRNIADNPETLGLSEEDTVRFYGSPLRFYPGERLSGLDVRLGGDINTTVDWLAVLSSFSSGRYPTNDELALLLSMQASVLANNISLNTRVLKVEKNTNPNIRGTKIVTLEIPTYTKGQRIRNETGGFEFTKVPAGRKIIKIATDGLFVATGLGEPTYGFDLKGSRAERVIEETKDSKFPKITTTLESFRYFVKTSKRLEIETQKEGETIVIWGGGNSADTLIEYIGQLFQGDNPNVRNISKIYVISRADLSQRPRYAQIRDLKSRNGQSNLVELVSSRVKDVGYASEEGNPSERKLVFYDSNGQVVLDSKGKPINADYAIAATGFTSGVEEVFSDYSESVPGSETRRTVERTSLTLPTNSEVPVADQLEQDPSVIFLGTASNPNFDLLDKLAQLPAEAREALLRNGAENAVAIGFRSPDVQAAVNIFLNSFDVEAQEVRKRRKISIDLTKPIQNVDYLVTRKLDVGEFKGASFGSRLTQFEVDEIEPNETLTSLNFALLGFLAREIGEVKSNGTVTLKFKLSFPSADEFDVDPYKSPTVISRPLVKISRETSGKQLPNEIGFIFDFFLDQEYQRAVIAFIKSLEDPVERDLKITIRNGKIDLQNTRIY